MLYSEMLGHPCVCSMAQRLCSCLQAGKGSATLSMAYAAAKFAESCLKALQGEPGVVECAYVSSHLTDLPFFASPLRLDQNGIAVRLYIIGLSMVVMFL